MEARVGGLGRGQMDWPGARVNNCRDLPAPEFLLCDDRLLYTEVRRDTERLEDGASGQVGARTLNVDVNGLTLQIGQRLDFRSCANMHVVVVKLADVLHLCDIIGIEMRRPRI